MSADRARDALERLLVGILPTMLARAIGTALRWEYRVTGVNSGHPVTVSGTPAGNSPFGDLANITLWPAAGGGYAIPQPGSLIVIEFHEGNVGKPAVCKLDPNTPPTLAGYTVTISAAQFAAAAPANSGGNVAYTDPTSVMHATVVPGTDDTPIP